MSGTVAIIQARFGSKRLPGKILLDLAGAPVLARVLDRVRACSGLDGIVIATTTNAEDDATESFGREWDTRVFRGSRDDVLDRYAAAARTVEAERVVRITADCPLIDPAVIDKVVAAHLASGAEYTSNICPPTYPDGLDVEVLETALLERVAHEASLKSDREHVTTYIRNAPERFSTLNVAHESDLSRLRWTLDTPEDYTFILEITRSLHVKNPVFGMDAVLEFLSTHPDVARLNSHIGRNEGYQTSLEEDSV